MVAISQSDGFPRPITQPATPRRGDVGRLLKQMNLEYGLQLPWNEHESPSKKRKSPSHEVANTIAFLYYQDNTALNQAVDEFAHWLPKLDSAEKKINYLLETLTIAKTSCLKAKANTRTPRSLRRSPRERQSTRSADLPEPASPTLFIKHAPTSSIEMPADDFRLPPARSFKEPSLKRPRSTQSLTDKMRASGSRAPHVEGDFRATSTTGLEIGDIDPFSKTILPPIATLPAAQKSGTTSMNTSFMSNAVTSFSDSIWSDAQQGTQDPGTPDTNVEDSFHTPDEKDGSFGLDGGNEGWPDSQYWGDPPSSFGLQATDASVQPSAAGTHRIQDVGSSDQPGSTYPGPLSTMPDEETDRLLLESLAPVAQQQLPTPPESVAMPEPHVLTGDARVERIASDGLSPPELPLWFAELPWEVRWEAMRVLQTQKITADALGEAWQSPRTLVSLVSIVRSREIPFEPSDRAPLADITFTANLRWSRLSKGRVFELQLLPARKDKSNSLEREYGRHRFLILNVPSLTQPLEETGLRSQRSSIGKHVREMYNRDQLLLGRVWHRILIQGRDSKLNDPDFAAAGSTQVYFFAERSECAVDALPRVKHEDVLNWWIPFASNGRTTECKAYTRLDLGVSRTRPVKTLEDSDIEYGAPDDMPNKELDNTEFDDPKLPNPMLESGEAMTDGCARISSRVMRYVQEAYDLDYLPSVVQARICGAKGLWYRDDDDNFDLYDEHTSNATQAKAIKIVKSQVKVWQDAAGFRNAEKRTLNVNNYNRAPQCAYLYTSFLPIMVDRHVPRQAIVDAAQNGIKGVTETFLEALHDSDKMLCWIRSNVKSSTAFDAGESDDKTSSFPSSEGDRITRMLHAGFETASCKHLADKVSSAAQHYFKTFRERIKIPIAKSTVLLGICDPTGVVEPNTIHVGFLNAFHDGERQRNSLKGLQALVGRLPALGRTDMQRVRCVYHPELVHLTDVAIFSKRGPRSLASKLQGGDYDGDQFIIIWEPPLVRPFLNAPVQAPADEAEQFGIKRNGVLLEKTVPTDQHGHFRDEDVAAWQDRNTEARLNFDYVGMVTNQYDALVYHTGNLSSVAAKALLQLHDHLLDAPKNGYSFDAAAWNRICKKHNLQGMQTPAWRRYVKGEDISKVKPNDKNIIDYVLFRQVETVLQDALKQAADIVAKAPMRDDQLNNMFTQTRKMYPMGTAGRNELETMMDKLLELKKNWTDWMDVWRQSKDKTTAWRIAVDKARQSFVNIEPENPGLEAVKGWLITTGEGLRTWDLLKASALCVVNASPSLMFEAAGHELCEIKADAVKGAWKVRQKVMQNLKPCPQKRKAESDPEPREQDGLTVKAGIDPGRG